MDKEKQESTGAKKKKYLSRYINNLRKVERLEGKLAILKDRLISIRSPSCSGMPRGGSSYTVEDMIVDVADLETRIESLRAKGRNIKREILDYIDTLVNPVYAKILERQYIDDLPHTEIGKLLGHTTSTIGLYYRRALAELEDPLVP